MWQFFLFMGLEPFFYYFVLTNTMNLSNVNRYCHISTNIQPGETSKAPWDNYIHTLQGGRKILWYLFMFTEL